MKRIGKIVAVAAACAALAGSVAAFSACGSGDVITIAGSTSVQPLMSELADAYYEKTGVTVKVDGGGSGVGISKAQDGTVDLGMASKEVTDKGVTPIQIATDGIALIVSADSALEEVSKQEVYDLYANHTAIQNIVTDAVSRDSSSGTREAFMELIELETIYAGQPELTSQDAVIENVAASDKVIGYCSLEALAGNTTIKGVSYKENATDTAVAPTTENVASGAYTLARPFNIVYNTENGLSDLVNDFIDFIFSDEGAAIIEANGQVVVADSRS